MQKAGKTAGCAHPEKKAADGEREIHAAVHDVSRREGTGVKPDFFPRILQEPEGVLLFFEGILFRNPDIDAASQVCGFHGIQDRDAGEELPADGSQNSVSPGIAFLGFIGQRLGHFSFPAVLTDDVRPGGEIAAELKIAFRSAYPCGRRPGEKIFFSGPFRPVGNVAAAQIRSAFFHGNTSCPQGGGKIKAGYDTVFQNRPAGRKQDVGTAHGELGADIAAEKNPVASLFSAASCWRVRPS